MVRLPATECPECRANLRTGEKPEEYVPIWKRGKGKLVMILTILLLPSITWSVISSQTEEGLAAYLRDRLGLKSCADPRDMWEDFDQDEFERGVKNGYGNWNTPGLTRNVGQGSRGPETPEEAARPVEEKIVMQDTQSYFASTLMSYAPSQSLKPQDNWFILMPGEWDVAYITGQGTRDELILAGEWTFTWINDGQALQDVLSVPYRWQKPPADFQPIQSTSVRVFNPKLGLWEGFLIRDGHMFFFRASKNAEGKIVEHYQAEGGPLVVTVFSDFKPGSFKAAISQSTNNGASYSPVAEIWAKKRETVIP
jgi:hypothetical protein